MKNNKNNKKNNKGFTLIELLATIAILAIVASISIYISMDVVRIAKLKSYQVTINNVEKNANTYVAENGNKIFYLTSGNNEYQCITVGNLIEMGYLDTNVINSQIDLDGKKVSIDDFIYIERDAKSKTLLKSVYDKDNDYNCMDAVKAEGDITFVVTPNMKQWSREKDVTINYKVKNRQNVTSYQNVYSYDSKTSNRYATQNPMKVTIEKEDTTIHAKILNGDEKLVYKTLYIDKIDRTGPIIEIDGNSVEGNVNDEITINIKVIDPKSGVNTGSIDKTDFEVKIGGTTIPLSSLELTEKSKTLTEVKYGLKITDNTHRGELEVKVPANSIFDNIENGNEETSLDLSLTMNKVYKVTASANGGTIPSTSGWTGTGSSAYKNVTYAASYGALPTPTRTGYTFAGWFTAASGGTQVTNTTTVSITAAQTLYAHWTANNCIITFDVNTTNTNIISVNPTTKTIAYGNAYGTLPEPNNTMYGSSPGTVVQVFTGWYNNSTSGNAVTEKTKCTTPGAITVYAHWANVTVPNPEVIEYYIIMMNYQSTGCKSSAASALACMQANSEAWWSAKAAGDTDKMTDLHDENVDLSHYLETTNAYFEPNSGVWYEDDTCTTPLYTVESGKTITVTTPTMPTYPGGYPGGVVPTFKPGQGGGSTYDPGSPTVPIGPTKPPV